MIIIIIIIIIIIKTFLLSPLTDFSLRVECFPRIACVQPLPIKQNRGEGFANVHSIQEPKLFNAVDNEFHLPKGKGVDHSS